MKKLIGTVTSTARQKTVTVKLERLWQHPLYKKYVTRSKKYSCHVEDLDLKEGDKVTIQECRPISKTKFFRVINKLSN